MFGLIALVGIVNIIAALAMIIIEKKAQIGILISQGFSKPNIQMVFMIQGGFIGIMGGLFGGNNQQSQSQNLRKVWNHHNISSEVSNRQV